MPAGIASAVGGVANAIIGSNAAGQASKAIQQGVSQATGFDQSIYNQAQQNLQPFVGYGQTGANALQGLLGIGGNPQAANQAFQNYLKSTPYQFLLNQGLQGQSYLNAPNLFSGATGKAFNNYAQGMAGQAIFPYLNMLQNQQGMGIQAGTNLGNIGTNIAGLNQQALLQGAGSQASLDLFRGGQMQNALGGITGLFGQSSFGGGLGSGLNAFGQALGGNFTGAANILGMPGSATAQQSAFGNVAGLF